MEEEKVTTNELTPKKSNVLRTVKRKLKKLDKKWRIAILVVLIAGVAVGTFFLLRVAFTQSPEERLNLIVSDYYTREIEPASQKGTSYTLVLKNLKTLGYDVSSFEEDGCSLDSYAVIYLNNTGDGAPYIIDTKLVGCQ